MKARIEKKLSKRLVEIAPKLLKGAWKDEEISNLAEKQGTSIRHVYSVGGGVDYWGDGQDWQTAWKWWSNNWPWHGDFPEYPSGHEHAHFPDVSGFKQTTKNILALAVECNRNAK